jgi:hypothetical protein
VRRLSVKRVTAALADAVTLGDAEACKKHGISSGSLKRYRAKMRPALIHGDPKIKPPIDSLYEDFLREAIQAMREKLPEGRLFEVAGATKIVGELRLAGLVLGEDDDGRRAVDGRQVPTIEVQALPSPSAPPPSSDARH